ncbi:MAG: PIN domain nuclease [Sedimentisphaerales bacterium]
MIVVDSSVWIDYFNGKITEQTNLLDSLLEDELIVIGDIILTEVLQGFRNDNDFRKARDLFDSLIFREMLGKDSAINSAENYRYLRKMGVTIRKTIDVMIATFCVENQMPLLHCDKDFEPLERYLGLKVIP